MPSPQLVVMAAGIGSRYGGLKQIEPIGPSGEIIIDYALYDARRAGFERILFVIRKDIESAFRERMRTTVEKQFDVQYAYQRLDDIPQPFTVPTERTKPWGTGHAVLSVRDKIDAPFAVINADDFYGQESFKNLFTHLSGATDRNGTYDFCMVGYCLANTLTEHGHVARGICTASADGYLETIVERTKIQRFGNVVRYLDESGEWVDIDENSTVSMNMFGFTRGFMHELSSRFPTFLQKNIGNPKSEYYLPLVVNELIHENKARVAILPTSDRWLGVTYREDTEQVRSAIRGLVANGQYPQRLWE